MFTNESPRRVHLIVDRLTGVAQPIFNEQPQHFLQEGQLTPTGALFTASVNNTVAQLHEWTPAALVPLGPVVRPWITSSARSASRVHGRLFSRERETQQGYRVYDLVRRDLPLRATKWRCSKARTIPSWTSDLAANGDVVFRRNNGYAYDLVRYRQGVFEPLAVAAPNINYAGTDGTLVVAEVGGSQGWSCRVHAPTGVEALAQNSSGVASDVRVQEGWVACRMPFSALEVWTRNPSGARQPIQLPTSARIDAVGGDGSLLYNQTVGLNSELRRYLRRGNIPAIDVGSGKWPVQRLDRDLVARSPARTCSGSSAPRISCRKGRPVRSSTGRIALLNPSAESASVHTHYLKEGGEPAQYHRFFPARSRLTIPRSTTSRTWPRRQPRRSSSRRRRWWSSAR